MSAVAAGDVTGSRYAAATSPDMLRRWHAMLAGSYEEGTDIGIVSDEIADALDIATGWAPAAHREDAAEMRGRQARDG